MGRKRDTEDVINQPGCYLTGMFRGGKEATNFILILLGFLFQWHTILTLLMFPILVIMYTRLARKEERELHDKFGRAYVHYAKKTPSFFPNLNK